MQELLKLLKKHGDANLVYGEWNDFIGELDDENKAEAKTLSVFRSYDIECVKQRGGEGGGDMICAVFSVKKDGQDVGMFKASGWYASNYGAEFQKVAEVFPVQKTITVYQTKKEMKDEV